MRHQLKGRTAAPGFLSPQFQYTCMYTPKLYTWYRPTHQCGVAVHLVGKSCNVRRAAALISLL